MKEIQTFLNSLPLRKHIIDGEVTGKDWAQTMTLFRSSKADVNEKLKRYGRYKIFDLVNPHRLDEPFRDRRERLEEVFAKHSHPMVMLTKSEQIQSYDEFVELHNFHLASGCDGSIIKVLGSPYEFKRSGYWLKVKPQKTMDCLIVGFNEGKGKYVGMLGSLEVKLPMEAGRWSFATSNVSGMTDEDRVYMWKNRKKLLGTIVEVEYRKISEKKNRLIEGHVHRPRPDK